MSKKSSNLIRMLIALFTTAMTSSVAPANVIPTATWNGLEMGPNGGWSWNGNARAVMNVPFKITNKNTETVDDINIFFTGMADTTYGQLFYVNHGTWERKRGTKTLRAKMGLPTDMLPVDQEVVIVPGEPPDAQYPYLSIGRLRPGESRAGIFHIIWTVRGGQGDHQPPYTVTLCAVSGKRKTSNKNRPPTAYDDSVTTTVDTPAPITLYATDPDGDELTYIIGLTSEFHGDLVFDTLPNGTYTPDPGFIGTDSFAFAVFDEKEAWSNLAVVTITVTPAGGGEASFQGLGDLSGGSFFSQAFSISADGSTAVGGSSSASGDEAFRWTHSGGMIGLGDLPGGNFQSCAKSVSSDGALVVGYGNVTGTDGIPKTEAFRWTSGSGMVGLGFLPGGVESSNARGVSSDGSVVVGVGRMSNTEERAFRWTSVGGMMGYPSSTHSNSSAGDVSSDGQVMVGYVHNNMVMNEEAFLWTPGGGMVNLGDLPGGHIASCAYGVSPDGSVIVGYGTTGLLGAPGSTQAMRWESGLMTGLGILPGETFSYAHATSTGGSVVVGESGQQAFIWDEANGMRSLQGVLVGYGLDLTGWSLTDAMDISADGLTIVGYGTNPEGYTEGWIATLP